MERGLSASLVGLIWLALPASQNMIISEIDWTCLQGFVVDGAVFWAMDDMQRRDTRTLSCSTRQAHSLAPAPGLLLIC
jgi:hypothetical protein